MRQNRFKGSILEIGGGYSTILMKSMLKEIQITSIDVNPIKYNRIVNSPYSAKTFLKGISSINKASVTYKESILAFHMLFEKLLKFNKNEIINHLSTYTNNHFSENQLRDIISNKNKFLDIILRHPAHENDYKFYETKQIIEGEGFCKGIVSNNTFYDAIFFDCGEISSVAEWLLLNSQIRVGGYALLHDIFYPKSIKNFLVATHISLLPNWRILYIDKISQQGGLIAVKTGESNA